MSRASTDVATFFSDPSLDRFTELQQLARLSTGYDPYCRALLAIECSIGVRDPLASWELLSKLEDSHQSCPRFHYVSARVFEILGQEDQMQAAIQRLQICLQMIAESGTGTKNAPYSVAFVTDQDDIVRSFGEQKRCQQTVNSAKKQFDVVTAHSGEEFWFDVTEFSKAKSQNGEFASELN